MERRDFIVGAVTAAGLVATGGIARFAIPEKALLRPPGAQDENQLVGACLHCERCRSICHTTCISWAKLEDGICNVRTPILDFTRGYCDFCGDCADVCPTQSICQFDPETEKVGCAVLDRALCVNCTRCKDCCPYDALDWDEATQTPVVNRDLCNGCGYCEYICPSASYGTAGNAHRRAIAVER